MPKDEFAGAYVTHNKEDDAQEMAKSEEGGDADGSDKSDEEFEPFFRALANDKNVEALQPLLDSGQVRVVEDDEGLASNAMLSTYKVFVGDKTELRGIKAMLELPEKKVKNAFKYDKDDDDGFGVGGDIGPVERPESAPVLNPSKPLFIPKR